MSSEQANLIQRLASLPVWLQERGERVTVSMEELLVRKLLQMASQDNLKAINLALDLFNRAHNVVQSESEAEAETHTSSGRTPDWARQKLQEVQDNWRREREREPEASDSPLPSAEGMTEEPPSPSDAAADEDARPDVGAMKSQVSAIAATPARDLETDVGSQGKVDYEDPSHEALIMERDAILAEAFAISPVLSPSNDPRYFELIFALNRLNKQLPAHLRKQLDIS